MARRNQSLISKIIVLISLISTFRSGSALSTEVTTKPCPKGFTGINIHASQNPKLYDRVVEASLGWVRIDFNWKEIHFRAPVTGLEMFLWDRTDKAVRLAHERGLKVFATLAYAPEWIQQEKCKSQKGCPPKDSAAWARFVQAVVARYSIASPEFGGAAVEKWGLWNEPNLSAFWLGSREEFVDLILKPGFLAVKATNSKADVVAPDLAYGRKHRWQQWVKYLGKNALNFFDIFSFHVYVDDKEDFDNDSRYDTDGDLIALLATPIKKDLKRAGILDGQKRIWLTEFGWRTYKPEVVSYDDQAAYLVGVLRAVNQSKMKPDDLSWLNKVFIYAMVDDNKVSGSRDKWGILEGKHKDFAPKPSFFAIKELLDGFEQACRQ